MVRGMVSLYDVLVGCERVTEESSSTSIGPMNQQRYPNLGAGIDLLIEELPDPSLPLVTVKLMT